MITLTCGHTVEDLDNANDIALASYNREGNRCVDYVSYCDECYDAALDRGEVLLTVDDEDAWLQSRSDRDEVERLQAKKKQIHDELYDQVKMEMFKASSKLEGIDYEEDTVKLEPEQGITPDAWVIIEVNHEGEQFQKILSGWSGSYLYGDSWRMSSPIKELNIKVNQDFFTVETDSGSCYTLFKSRQGLRMSNAGIYNELKEKFGDSVEIIEL